MTSAVQGYVIATNLFRYRCLHSTGQLLPVAKNRQPNVFKRRGIFKLQTLSS